jgi:hypothetical protein
MKDVAGKVAFITGGRADLMDYRDWGMGVTLDGVINGVQTFVYRGRRVHLQPPCSEVDRRCAQQGNQRVVCALVAIS